MVLLIWASITVAPALSTGTSHTEAAASRGLSCPSASFPPSPFPETPRSRLYLHNAADDHGEDIQGEAENVEQSQGHEGLLGIQDVVLVDGHVDSKRGQGHLQADQVSIAVTGAVTRARQSLAYSRRSLTPRE